MLVDSHCHLDRLDVPLDEALATAASLEVQRFLCVSINLTDFPQVLAIAQQYPSVYASVGVHPTEEDEAEATLEQLVELAQSPDVVAIGETGLDYFHVPAQTPWQLERFRSHIRAAKVAGLPLIIHTRDAEADTLKIMQEESAKDVGGVMHCFTGSAEMAQACMEMGFYISFSGIITFKNATALQAVVKTIPLERLLVETDSPYLAPVPYRGKSNQPGYTRYVAEQMAALKDVSYDTIRSQTTNNFYRCFSRAIK